MGPYIASFLAVIQVRNDSNPEVFMKRNHRAILVVVVTVLVTLGQGLLDVLSEAQTTTASVGRHESE